MRLALTIMAAFALSGCGVVYYGSDLDASDENVTVVPLNFTSVQQANADTRYVPKSLPAVFRQVAGGSGAGVEAGALPDPIRSPQVRPGDLELRLPPQTSAPDYALGVGDVVSLVLSNTGAVTDQDSRQRYTVQNGGDISVPNLGRLPVAGLTMAQAEEVVLSRLVERQIDPTFSLEVAEFNSQRVSVGGAVSAPTTVPVTVAAMDLGDVLGAAGGLSTADRSFSTIRLYRGDTIYQIPLEDYFGRPSLQNVTILPGDSVFVDTVYDLDAAAAYFEEQIRISQLRQAARAQALTTLSTEVALRRAALNEARANFQAQIELGGVDLDYAYLTGEVRSPGRFTLPFGEKGTLADALFAQGGGFDPETANPSQIYVLRGTENSARVNAFRLDARDAAHFVLATKFELRPNDVIFVAEQPVTRWNRVIQQIVPSLITSGANAVTK